MPELQPLQGELQAQVMAAVWRIGSGTVEQVRSALPPRYRGAYTTVQTVLNRLAERGLLDREKEGRGILYSPRLTEGDYVAQLIRTTLAGASADARQVALASIIGKLDKAELTELQRLARQADNRRGSRRR